MFVASLLLLVSLFVCLFVCLFVGGSCSLLLVDDGCYCCWFVVG